MLTPSKSCPKAVKPFLQRFEAELECAFFRYAESSRIDGYLEPAFWYGEQQTKTFVTMALGNLCAGSALQEPPIKRSAQGDKHRGRVDYYCKFGNQGLFIEFKQSWMRNNRTNLPLVAFKEAHKKTAKQIHNIDRTDRDVKDWKVDYGIGMTIAPVWSDSHKQFRPVQGPRKKDAIDRLLSEKLIHAVSYLETRVNTGDGKFLAEWKKGKAKHGEQYAGIFIAWYVREF